MRGGHILLFTSRCAKGLASIYLFVLKCCHFYISKVRIVDLLGEIKDENIFIIIYENLDKL